MSETPGEQHAPLPPPPAPDGAAGADDAQPRVPWGALDAVGVIAVAIPVAILLGGIVVALGQLADAPEVTTGLLLPLPLVVLAVVSVAWVQARFGAARMLTGPVRGRAVEWLIGGGLGVAAFIAVNLVLGIVLQVLAGVAGFELPEPQEDLRQLAADPTFVPWLLFAAVVVAPVAEELFFRGLLYQGLRRRIGVGWAGLVSALLFAAAHMLQEQSLTSALVAFVLILPLGVLLAVTFERRGSLAAPIAVHAAFNGITAAIMIAAPFERLMPA